MDVTRTFLLPYYGCLPQETGRSTGLVSDHSGPYLVVKDERPFCNDSNRDSIPTNIKNAPLYEAFFGYRFSILLEGREARVVLKTAKQTTADQINNFERNAINFPICRLREESMLHPRKLNFKPFVSKQTFADQVSEFEK